MTTSWPELWALADFGRSPPGPFRLLSVCLKGTPIMLDPAGSLFAAIGAGNLRALTGPQEGGTDRGVELSTWPRCVVATVAVTWPPQQGTVTYIRTGTRVDIKASSPLEAAYGGASNLRSLTAGELANAACDRSGLVN